LQVAGSAQQEEPPFHKEFGINPRVTLEEKNTLATLQYA
jgi:hypothetical protein